MLLKIILFISVHVVLFQCVVVWCQGSENGGLILTAQKKKDTMVQLTCITTDVGRALTWETQIVDKQKMPETKTLYTEEFTPIHGWLKENSLKNTLGPILDTRWEKLTTEMSEPSKPVYSNLKFKYLSNINLVNKFEVPISVRLALEGHIYICHKGLDPTDANCYWILLGAWNGTKSAIRKCKRGEISQNDKSPSGNCDETLDMVETNPLSKKNWKHFSIIFDDITKMVSVIFIGETVPFLKFHDNNYDKNMPFTSLWVNSRKNQQGYWKLHSRDFFIVRDWQERILGHTDWVTDFWCISMYVAMCESCRLVVSLVNYYNTNYEVYNQVYDSSEKSNWMKIKFSYINKFNINYFTLKVRIEANGYTDVDPFLAMDNMVKSTDCFKKETKYSSIMIKNSNVNNTFCQFLIGDENKLQIRPDLIEQQPDINCSPSSIGKNCFTCSDITILGSCKNNLICEKNVADEFCYCGAGSTGDFCDQDCTWPTYGINCNQQCGSCNDNSCNGIDGRCMRGCKNNFILPNCLQARFPILTSDLIVDSECYTTCNVKFNSTSYIGIEKPIYYRFEYKKSTANTWITSTKFDLQYNTFTLRDLEISTQYMLRVVLITESTQFFNDDIPFTNLTTICKEITSDAVKLHAESKKATFSIKPAESTESCKLYMYYISIKKENREVSKKELAADVIISNLLPHQSYTYTVYNQQDSAIISSEFQTDESAASVVRDVQYDSSQSEISISWNKPENPNGDINGYSIYYVHKQYIFCPLRKNLESQDTITTSNNYVNITELIPYSIYIIKIRAINKYEGVEITSEVATKSKDELFSDAYSINVTAGVNQVKVKFIPKCEVISAPIIMNMLVTCTEKWGNTNKSVEIKLPKDTQIIDKLQPFSNHALTVTLSNQNSNAVPIVLPVIIFKTEATVPNEISSFDFYSTDSTSISLRWSPPYPPTGEIEQYRVMYATPYTTWSVFNKYHNCTIWPGMYCMKISSLYTDAYYYFKISATNIGVAGWSREYQLETYINIKKPLQPKNLIAYWDDQYNITAEWQHPDKTNGLLRSFSIAIGSMKEISQKIVKENLTYTYTTNVEPKDGTLKIAISSVNSKGKSPYINYNIDYPPPKPELSIDRVVKKPMNMSIELDIPPAEGLKLNSYMYVMVSQIPDYGKVFNPSKINMSEICSSAVKVYTSAEMRNRNTLIIGNGEVQNWSLCQNKIINRALIPGTKFNIYFLIYNEAHNLTRGNIYQLEETTIEVKIPDPSNSALYFLLILLVIPIFLVFFIIRKKKIRIGWPSTQTVQGISPDTIPLTKTPAKEKNGTNSMSNMESNVPSRFSHPVKLDDFENYVKDSIFNGELARQHAMFPRGEQKPNEYGKLPPNKSKNRYMNLVSYNHTRVKLSKINGDAYSDYINANYIKGFNSPRAYIATQGPKPNTVDDFWRMIWEKSVAHVVMLANVFENGKRKTEKYWPNYNEDINFGIINVRHISTEVFADYEFRIFYVKCNGEERKVEQLHFTTWPDHGVPLYPQSLVPFVKKILTFPQDTAPIIVHCSAGVGRTGTIILIDLCLRMAAQTGIVDILRQQYHLREQRTNMVDNLEQFKLVHLVVFECLFSPDTTLPCNEGFEQAMRRTVEHELKKQMDYIKRSAWQEEAISGKDTTRPVQQLKKNRYEDAPPPETYGVIYLTPSPPSDETSTYINAVTVDGFKAPKSFITTQQPLPHTVGDFWRMVNENDVCIVISLQEIDRKDATCCSFWPDESNKIMNATKDIEIHHNQTESIDTFDLFSLSLSFKSENRKVIVVALKGWNYGTPYPNNFASLLAVWQQMNQLSWKENRVVVTCKDGITGCGLYTAMCFTLEKIKLEQICDVCHGVRVVRRSRRQFVASEAQFVSLYEIVLLYLNEFELYSNFSSK